MNDLGWKIETERLQLTPFTLDDVFFIIDLLNSEGWLRYIGDRNVKSVEQATNYLLKGPLASYDRWGFGLSKVSLKDGTPIGMCGLLQREQLPAPDIGFALLPAYAGTGYGYEISSSVIAYSKQTKLTDKLLAITLPENQPSIKLLGKLGFVYDGEIKLFPHNEKLSLYMLRF